MTETHAPPRTLPAAPPPSTTVLTAVPTGTEPDRRNEEFARELRDHLARYPIRRTTACDTAAHDLTVEVRTLGLTLDPTVGADRAGAVPEPDAAHARGAGGRTVPVHFYGDTVIVGPIHTTGGPTRPCGACLRRRWTRLRPERERRALESGRAHTASGAGSAVPAAWHVPAVAAALDRLGQEGPRASGTDGLAEVLEIDLTTGATTRFGLLADPGCGHCAVLHEDAPPATDGFPAPRPLPAPGGTRLRGWDAAPLPVDALTNRLCGAVGTSRANRLSTGINAPVTGRLRLGGRRSERTTLYDITWGGHAASYRESRALGLLEGLERYAGQRPHGRRPALRAALADLDRATDPDAARPALDPRDTVLYEEGFYERDHGRPFVPFDPARPISWVWGHSFDRGGPLLVPAQLAYYGPHPVSEQFVLGSSSGCATGSCLEEAALHGLFELVERDAFMVNWYSAARLPEIDPDSCTEPQTVAAVDRMRALGYEVRLFDLRVDLPVPIVLCVARLRTPGHGNLCMSAGVAPDPADAALAAVREVASYLPGFAARSAQDEPELRALVDDYAAVTELDHHGALYGLPRMADRSPFPGPRGEVRPLDVTFADWTPPLHRDLRAQLTHYVDLVRTVARDVVVVEQTCPEQRAAEVATAAVIAPGLVPIDFGWDYQRVLHTERLRTAAWRAGRRSAPLGEDEVHRHPHPFL
ncbi:TOMM precursor leader peptide-binding protein [Streptomyces sp. NPDC059917]|uniref:TOMM precursor leader peptide-binding protein n=1 Tax=Streptomyces sp. NPDC059917 TaxID=3347002 RepID=UPI00365467BD